MDLDTIFVASVLKGGREAVRFAIERGVDEDCLGGKGLTAWKFVLDYLKQYHDVPDPGVVEGKTNVKLPDPDKQHPPAFWVDEVLNRRLHNAIGDKLLAITAHFKARDPQAAFQEYADGLHDLRKLGAGVAKTVSLFSLGPEFLDYYDKIKAGYRGILTPWPTINEATLGFWPEDFVLYVARLGVGKTWALAILANHVWTVQKKRVLFVTTEMSQLAIVRRWIAIHYKYPYNDLRKGMLSAFAEQRMRDDLSEKAKEEGLYLIGGDFDFRIESIEGAIEESEPDVVFVDGAYLLKVKGEGRIEKAANSFDELKRVAKRNHLPLVASTQFNREVKGNKLSTAGPEKIALSDAAGWNADLIFGLVRTDDMKRDKRMIQLPLKFREGEGDEIETHWDFDTMNFDELPKGAAAATAGAGGAGGAGGGQGGGAGSGASGGGTAPDPDPYGTGLLFGDDDDTKDQVPF